MAISAKQVKELREKTGAGMMDCKKPLQNATEILIKQLTGSVKKESAKRLKKKVVSLQKD